MSWLSSIATSLFPLEATVQKKYTGWNPFKDSWFGKSRAKRQQEEAKKTARDAYQLQVDMWEWQKEQLDKLEKGKESEAAKKAAETERLLAVKRQGRASTLKTVEIKPDFETFKAKYNLKNKGNDAITAYGKMAAFKRKNLGTTGVRKKTLYD